MLARDFVLARQTAAIIAAGVVGAYASTTGASAAVPMPGTYPWALHAGLRQLTSPIGGTPSAQRERWPEKVLYAFTGPPDGEFPNPLIAGSHGELYGTTVFGGTGSCVSEPGCGTVFELVPPSKSQPMWTETVLYSFSGGADGAAPVGKLTLGAHGVLYGAASCQRERNRPRLTRKKTPPPLYP